MIRYLSLIAIFTLQLLPGITAQTQLTLTLEDGNHSPVSDIPIYADGQIIGTTDINGFFKKSLSQSPAIISILAPGFEPFARQLSDISENVDLGTITLIPLLVGQTQLQIGETPSDEDDQDEDISSLLTASRDLFVSSAAFNWGPLRFNQRGYEPGKTNVMVNGFVLNDTENGRVNWNVMSGLNDVTRNSYGSVALGDFDFDFGNIGGSVTTDLTASSQRKQIRASYSVSNRSYNNRLMLTYGSGRTRKGWYLAASISHRWAQEGYTEGTFYDAWAYYLAASKEWNTKHKMHVMAFGAPVSRGKSSPGIPLSYELAGTNYYNSYWGYQNGEKRNSRVAHSHLPTAIIRYDWNPNRKFSMSTMLGYQKGSNGATALNWTDASDPRPDYYQKLPNYFINNPDVFDLLYQELSENKELRQVQWDVLYNRNRENERTIVNANGVPGQEVTGRQALYMVEDRRYDPTSFQANIMTQYLHSDHLIFDGGVRYIHTSKDNYKMVDDLLGADFLLDINKFEDDDIIRQTDLNTPDRLAYEEDRFGYSYQSEILKRELWLQPKVILNRLDAFVGLRLGHVQYRRNGDFRTGPFPDNSFGPSRKVNFSEFSVKAGATYKISGRHYLYFNGYYSEDAPLFSNSMVSPRTRNDYRNDLKKERSLSLEGAYVLRGKRVKGKFLAYYTTISDRIRHQTAFLDNDLGFGEFGNILTSNIDQRHVGVEAVIEHELGYGFEVGAAAALGQHLYADRFLMTIMTDISPEPLVENETIYSRHFYIPGSPQQAFAVELKYNSKKYWFASLTGNYIENRYLDFYPLRRTEAAVAGLDRELDDKVFRATIEQERIDPAFTLNFFGGKSWRVDDYYIYLTIGINNILNDQNIITGGFEQFRFAISENKPDLDRFPNKYYYAYGLNYFINLSIRL